MGIDYIGKCLLVEDEGKRVLVVGDLHLGFEERLNKSGILVLRKSYDEIISDFNEIFDVIEGEVDEVVLLGDLKHTFGRGLGQEWNEVLKIFDYLGKKCKRIIVIKGNHDNYLENIASKVGVEIVDYYILGETCFLHGDKDFGEVWAGGIERFVIGHVHPAVKLRDGVKLEKYKCFLKGKYKKREVIVVPSFMNYPVGSDPREGVIGLAWDLDFGDFDVKIVEENGLKVLDFGKLGKLD